MERLLEKDNHNDDFENYFGGHELSSMLIYK